VKEVLDQRPELETQLSALLREIWAMASLVEGCTQEELKIKTL
jgi:hypothetical protein